MNRGNRFSMAIENKSAQYQKSLEYFESYVKLHAESVSKTQQLNTFTGSMIERVHKAKPGCSACGK
jgi:hypothetical protein